MIIVTVTDNRLTAACGPVVFWYGLSVVRALRLSTLQGEGMEASVEEPVPRSDLRHLACFAALGVLAYAAYRASRGSLQEVCALRISS